MKRRILTGLLLAIFALSIAVPVLAEYWAYLTIEESDGNDYTNLPVTCFRNITQLADYDIITSTGLDTRVLTGDGDPLPHMLAEDRIMAVTDLATDEEKTLIFYTGATSLSSFPIIPGYGGYITTPDTSQLEKLWIMEQLISGYFDTSSGSDKNICYKEDAYKMNISAANTLRVAALEAGDVEQWDLTYSSFTTGEHAVYVMANGLEAYLYVDDFEIAKDTANFFATDSATVDGTGYAALPAYDKTFYAAGRYWAFYHESVNDDYIRWKTSTDGSSWSSEQTVAIYNSADIIQPTGGFSVFFDGTYCHIAYADYDSGAENFRYRRGTPETDNTITWSDVWQTASGGAYAYAKYVTVAADADHYPMIAYTCFNIGNDYGKLLKSSTNDGTWATAGGYPLEYSLYQIHAMTCNPYADNKGYAVARKENDSDTLYGKHYNGSTWAGTWQTLVPAAGGTIYHYEMDVVMDADDNAYIAYGVYHVANYYTVHLIIRYADGSLSDVIDIAGGDGPGNYSRYLAVSYNPDNDIVYMFYTYDGDDTVKARTIYNEEISAEYTLFSHDAFHSLGSSPYGAHIGISVDEPGGIYAHGIVDLSAYNWTDNANNWTWMQNNVMPYADSILMAVDGVTHLEYEPDGIIEDSILPDLSENSDNDGIITWGDNPEGVAASLSTFSGDDEGESTPVVVPPGEAGFTDIVGPTGQPGWTGSLPTLATNPFYPLVAAISEFTNIPVGLIWIIGATLLLILAMVVTVWKVPHLIVTALVGGGLSAFWFAMGIYPFWVMFIFAIMALAIIVGERSPTV